MTALRAASVFVVAVACASASCADRALDVGRDDGLPDVLLGELTSPNVAFDAVAAARCVAALDGDTVACSAAGGDDLLPCNDVIAGSLDVGAACAFDAECLAGTTCSGDSHTAPFACCGTCAPRATGGELCDRGDCLRSRRRGRRRVHRRHRVSGRVRVQPYRAPVRAERVAAGAPHVRLIAAAGMHVILPATPPTHALRRCCLRSSSTSTRRSGRRRGCRGRAGAPACALLRRSSAS